MFLKFNIDDEFIEAYTMLKTLNVQNFYMEFFNNKIIMRAENAHTNFKKEIDANIELKDRDSIMIRFWTDLVGKIVKTCTNVAIKLHDKNDKSVICLCDNNENNYQLSIEATIVEC